LLGLFRISPLRYRFGRDDTVAWALPAIRYPLLFVQPPHESVHKAAKTQPKQYQ
jgi:hypothetical protein